MKNVLDDTYIPCSTDEFDLFQEQKAFMYSVFEEHLLTDMGKTLVGQYEATSDSQAIYRELVVHMRTSTAGSMAASEPLSMITSLRMHNAKWSGTKRGFILHWSDKVRQYNSLVTPNEQLKDDLLKSLLINVVSGIPTLQNVKIQEDMSIQRGNSPLNYREYLRSLTGACDAIDRSITSLASRTKSLDINQYEFSDFDGHDT